MTDTDTDTTPDGTGDETSDDASPVSRRALLAALVGAGVGGAGAAGIAQSGAAASGALGESGNALQAAYLAELRGPILDQGTPIDQLVNIRVAETGTTVNADPGTLIIRYQP
jgi:hypothetical protein